MARLQRLSLLALAMFVVVGCIEKKETITINPDGSGKESIDIIMMQPPQMGGPEGAPDPTAKAKEIATNMVFSSTGVDAWKDVKFEALQDGRLHVSGTAYFSNIRELEIANTGKMNVYWDKQEDGSVLFTIRPNDGPAEAPKMTEEEITTAAAQAKTQYTQMKPMMAGAFSSLKLTGTYLLPGTTSDITVFTPVEGGVSYTIEGKNMIAAMDKFMADETMIAASIRAGRQPGQGSSEEDFNEALFGAKGQLKVKVTDLKAHFDYKAEMEAAKAAQPAMEAALGLVAPPAVPVMPYMSEEAPVEAPVMAE